MFPREWLMVVSWAHCCWSEIVWFDSRNLFEKELLGLTPPTLLTILHGLAWCARNSSGLALYITILPLKCSHLFAGRQLKNFWVSLKALLMRYISYMETSKCWLVFERSKQSFSTTFWLWNCTWCSIGNVQGYLVAVNNTWSMMELIDRCVGRAGVGVATSKRGTSISTLHTAGLLPWHVPLGIHRARASFDATVKSSMAAAFFANFLFASGFCWLLRGRK